MKQTLPIEALNDAGCQVLLLDGDFELEEGDELKLGLVTEVVVRAAHYTQRVSFKTYLPPNFSLYT